MTNNGCQVRAWFADEADNETEEDTNGENSQDNNTESTLSELSYTPSL